MSTTSTPHAPSAKRLASPFSATPSTLASVGRRSSPDPDGNPLCQEETRKEGMWTSEYARPMNAIPKVVCSRTLQNADWAETRVARGDLAEEIGRLKCNQDVPRGQPRPLTDDARQTVAAEVERGNDLVLSGEFSGISVRLRRRCPRSSAAWCSLARQRRSAARRRTASRFRDRFFACATGCLRGVLLLG
jgi:hypothetical protein